MGINLIRWQLIDVMDTYQIRASDLAKEMGLSKNAVSNLRSTTMPRLTGQRLNDLLLGLNRLRPKSAPIIEPKDLICFSLTPAEVIYIENRVEPLFPSPKKA